MSDTIESAAAVLGTAPELPRATPGVVAQVPQDATPAPAGDTNAPPAAPTPQPNPDRAPVGTQDRRGERHDPRIHEVPARINAQGAWARKRGNAARLAAGKPLAGITSGAQPRPRPDPAPSAGTTPTPASPSGQDSQPPPASVLNGAPPVVDGVPMGAEMAARPLEDYAGTAVGITEGQFGALQLAFGKAWEPGRDERSAWVNAWQRTLHHYQVTPFGPLVELVILAVSTIAKRRSDPETKEKAGRLWDFLKNYFRKRQPGITAANSHDWRPPTEAAADRTPAPFEAGAIASVPGKPIICGYG